MSPTVFGLTIMGATLVIGLTAIWVTEAIVRRVLR